MVIAENETKCEQSSPLSEVVTLSVLARLLDRELCSLAILAVFKNELFFSDCPSCGSPLGRGAKAAVADGRRGRCSQCAAAFNRWTDTPLCGAQIKPEQIVALGACKKLEIPIRQAAEVAGVSPTTAYFWYKRGEDLDIFPSLFGTESAAVKS